MAKLQNPSKYCLKPAGEYMWQKRRGQQGTNRHLQKMMLESAVGGSIPPPPPPPHSVCASSQHQAPHPAGRTQERLHPCTRSQSFSLRLGAEEHRGKVLWWRVFLLQQGRHFSSQPRLCTSALLSAAALCMREHCRIFHCLTITAWAFFGIQL